MVVTAVALAIAVGALVAARDRIAPPPTASPVQIAANVPREVAPPPAPTAAPAPVAVAAAPVQPPPATRPAVVAAPAPAPGGASASPVEVARNEPVAPRRAVAQAKPSPAPAPREVATSAPEEGSQRAWTAYSRALQRYDENEREAGYRWARQNGLTPDQCRAARSRTAPFMEGCRDYARGVARLDDTSPGELQR